MSLKVGKKIFPKDYLYIKNMLFLCLIIQKNMVNSLKILRHNSIFLKHNFKNSKLHLFFFENVLIYGHLLSTIY